MEVKIDTREKFHVITIKESNFAANMTAELDNCLAPLLKSDVKNVILNMSDIQMMDDAASEYLVKIQQDFYEQNVSFVVCCLKLSVEEGLDESGLLEIMNVTPSESEAWDIVQMEEIEREFLNGEEGPGL
ncbi:MAG: STAS domain-containing protein [Chitinophagaceae bacterium]